MLNEEEVARYDQLKADNDTRTERIESMGFGQAGLNELLNACMLEALCKHFGVFAEALLHFEEKRSDELDTLVPQVEVMVLAKQSAMEEQQHAMTAARLGVPIIHGPRG